jgi:signal transduction histidine kinase
MSAGTPAFTVDGMASQGRRPAEPARAPERGTPWSVGGYLRLTRPISAAAIGVAAVGVALELPGHSAAVITGAIVAVLVAAAGIAFLFLSRSRADGPDTVALIAAGFAGIWLAATLPNAPGLVIVFLSFAALGMRLQPRPAIAAGLVVFVAMNLAFWLAGKMSLAQIGSQDIGAAFLFAIGAFTRSARIAQDQARAAQARAEALLIQLRASQAAQAAAAALTERARLAREIHDILAHALSGLVLSLDTMELLGRQAAGDQAALEQLRTQVTRGQRIARDGLADTKRAISALRGDELPGPALLGQLVRDTAAATGLQAELSISGAERPLPPEIGLALYRTAQEALTNSAKYSGPGAAVRLRLSYGSDQVELAVQDARPGTAPVASQGELTFGGYGLTGMRERAELLGGSLTAGPTQAGFGVLLRLPAAAANGSSP